MQIEERQDSPNQGLNYYGLVTTKFTTVFTNDQEVHQGTKESKDLPVLACCQGHHEVHHEVHHKGHDDGHHEIHHEEKL